MGGCFTFQWGGCFFIWGASFLIGEGGGGAPWGWLALMVGFQKKSFDGRGHPHAPNTMGTLINVTFCVVQGLIQYTSLQYKDGQKWIKKHLKIMIGSQAFLFEKKKYMSMKCSNTCMPLFSINRHYITSNITLLNKHMLKLTLKILFP